MLGWVDIRRTNFSPHQTLWLILIACLTIGFGTVSFVAGYGTIYGIVSSVFFGMGIGSLSEPIIASFYYGRKLYHTKLFEILKTEPEEF